MLTMKRGVNIASHISLQLIELIITARYRENLTDRRMKRRSEKGKHVPGNELRMQSKFAIRVNLISSNLKRSNASNPVCTKLEMFGAGKFTSLQV